MENKYNIKYKGKFDSLDALVVFNSQIQFVNIINEIALIQFPEVTFSHKVRGFKKGSLDVQQLLEISMASGIFAHENYEYVKKIFEIFGDIIKLRNFLKDKKATQITKVGENQIQVTIKGNNITVAENAIQIYQSNPFVNNAFNTTAKLLIPEKDISSIEVSSKDAAKKNQRLLTIKKKDLEGFSFENPYLNKKFSEYIYPQQIIYIKKPNLFPEKGRKWYWHMLHKGRDIHARIEDVKFKRLINDGKKIGQGDRLKADLIVKLRYDEKLATFLETNKFVVKNITEVIDRPEQMKFKL